MDIVNALENSKVLELNKNKLSVRRVGNPALPAFMEKKRDVKANDKQQAKAKNQED